VPSWDEQYDSGNPDYTKVDYRTINLQWEPAGTDQTGFLVEKRISYGQWQTLATVGPDVTSTPDTQLLANTNYYYRVTAIKKTPDVGTLDSAPAYAPVYEVPFNVKMNAQWVYLGEAKAGFSDASGSSARYLNLKASGTFYGPDISDTPETFTDNTNQTVDPSGPTATFVEKKSTSVNVVNTTPDGFINFIDQVTDNSSHNETTTALSPHQLTQNTVANYTESDNAYSADPVYDEFDENQAFANGSYSLQADYSVSKTDPSLSGNSAWAYNSLYEFTDAGFNWHYVTSSDNAEATLSQGGSLTGNSASNVYGKHWVVPPGQYFVVSTSTNSPITGFPYDPADAPFFGSASGFTAGTTVTVTNEYTTAQFLAQFQTDMPTYPSETGTSGTDNYTLGSPIASWGAFSSNNWSQWWANWGWTGNWTGNIASSEVATDETWCYESKMKCQLKANATAPVDLNWAIVFVPDSGTNSQVVKFGTWTAAGESPEQDLEIDPNALQNSNGSGSGQSQRAQAGNGYYYLAFTGPPVVHDAENTVALDPSQVADPGKVILGDSNSTTILNVAYASYPVPTQTFSWTGDIQILQYQGQGPALALVPIASGASLPVDQNSAFYVYSTNPSDVGKTFNVDVGIYSRGILLWTEHETFDVIIQVSAMFYPYSDSGIRSGWIEGGLTGASVLNTPRYQITAHVHSWGVPIKVNIQQDFEGIMTVTYEDNTYTYCQTTGAPDAYLADDDPRYPPKMTTDTQGNVTCYFADSPNLQLLPAPRGYVLEADYDGSARDFVTIQVGSGPVQVVAEVDWLFKMEADFHSSIKDSQNHFPTILTSDPMIITNPEVNTLIYGNIPSNSPIAPPRTPTANKILGTPGNWVPSGGAGSLSKKYPDPQPTPSP